MATKPFALSVFGKICFAEIVCIMSLSHFTTDNEFKIVWLGTFFPGLDMFYSCCDNTLSESHSLANPTEKKYQRP